MVLNLVLNLNIMFKDQCISITDLKKNANSYIKSLDKHKVIFVNNKPVAVLVDIDTYESKFAGDVFDITFDEPISPSNILDTYKKEYGG